MINSRMIIVMIFTVQLFVVGVLLIDSGLQRTTLKSRIRQHEEWFERLLDITESISNRVESLENRVGKK